VAPCVLQCHVDSRASESQFSALPDRESSGINIGDQFVD